MPQLPAAAMCLHRIMPATLHQVLSPYDGSLTNPDKQLKSTVKLYSETNPYTTLCTLNPRP